MGNCPGGELSGYDCKDDESDDVDEGDDEDFADDGGCLGDDDGCVMIAMSLLTMMIMAKVIRMAIVVIW